MKEEIKKLNPILIELDDKLEADEFFTGISAVNNEGTTVFVGLAEKLDKMLRPLSKRYVNIKANHLKPKNDTFTKEDLKAAFYATPENISKDGVITNVKSFDDWFKIVYENKE
jgi:thermostable 8-oxoguanine DNA glycosylase